MVSQRLILLVSAFLVSTTSAFHVNPSQASPSPTQLGSSMAYPMDQPQQHPGFANAHNMHEKVRQNLDLARKQKQTIALPNMMDLTTPAEFAQHVIHQQEKMTIVRFHAPFCRACKAMQPAWERLARENPEINFVNVAYNKQNAQTKLLVNQMRVPKVPFGQVYHPTGGLVLSGNFGKKHFSNVVKHIEWYVHGECALEAEVDEYTNVYESPYMNIAV